MKKILFAALSLALAYPFSATAAAPEAAGYGIEVCVNASNEAEARRLFPKAGFHVLADFADPEMNGWRIVSGSVKHPGGRIMSDAEEIALRRYERAVQHRALGE